MGLQQSNTFLALRIHRIWRTMHSLWVSWNMCSTIITLSLTGPTTGRSTGPRLVYAAPSPMPTSFWVGWRRHGCTHQRCSGDLCWVGTGTSIISSFFGQAHWIAARTSSLDLMTTTCILNLPQTTHNIQWNSWIWKYRYVRGVLPPNSIAKVQRLKVCYTFRGSTLNICGKGFLRASSLEYAGIVPGRVISRKKQLIWPRDSM